MTSMVAIVASRVISSSFFLFLLVVVVVIFVVVLCIGQFSSVESVPVGLAVREHGG